MEYCHKCHKVVPEIGKKYCAKCLQDWATKKKRRREAGLCPNCGRPASPGKVCCRLCLQKLKSRLPRFTKFKQKESSEKYRKTHNVCEICGFNLIVEIHHKDHNRLNISPDNLIALCPNHHTMVHKGMLPL